ncbi:MAG: hypothetical protein AB7L66_16105 [Gemmatimonadales bacterium]
MSAAAVLAAALAAGCGRSRPAGRTGVAGEIVVADPVFSRPVAVAHDPLTDVYYVVNQGTGSAAGFISVLSAEGTVMAGHWIGAGAGDGSPGLDHPVAIAPTGEYLFVAEPNAILQFDRRHGTPQGRTPLEFQGIVDLVAAEDGTLFVLTAPDGAAASVVRVGAAGRDTLVLDASIGRPAHLAVGPDGVWVATAAGGLVRVGGAGAAGSDPVGVGGLAALAAFNGEAFVADSSGDIYRGRPGAPYLKMLAGFRGTTGLAHDLWRHRLLIARPDSGQVVVVPLGL